MSTKYLVIYEVGGNSFGAYIPDLPGCVAVGRSRSLVKKLIREAMSLHLSAMKKDGTPIPPPTSSAEIVSVKVR